jgi:hypothetical protein
MSSTTETVEEITNNNNNDLLTDSLCGQRIDHLFRWFRRIKAWPVKCTKKWIKLSASDHKRQFLDNNCCIFGLNLIQIWIILAPITNGNEHTDTSHICCGCRNRDFDSIHN